jgi:hypothetical protein
MYLLENLKKKNAKIERVTNIVAAYKKIYVVLLCVQRKTIVLLSGEGAEKKKNYKKMLDRLYRSILPTSSEKLCSRFGQQVLLFLAYYFASRLRFDTKNS